MDKQSLQEQYSPKGICFGCGPANAQGLRIKSYVEGDLLVAEWLPQLHHQAFPGVINGGIVGALLDCHSNWAAAWHLMKQSGGNEFPSTVTADYHVKLRRPTPADQPIKLVAKVEAANEKKVTVIAELSANGKLCATCKGTFIEVKPGHPAYHRW